MRYVLGIAMLLVALTGVSFAESAPATTATPAPSTPMDPATDAPWQAIVTSQIEAFRKGDGAAALEYASSVFKANFTDPDLFYTAILSGGYEPIVKSRSHSFGKFQKLSAQEVLQVVKFVGPDQSLYEALYQISKEADGWRINGVALQKQKGVGI
ncbi:DUF4864 domain-containing protein [Devosia sp.]|uniref:DUF4864 domain-containing protein n=1 Tax=Devosia sp. TaxID=1871048 RepID=UPI003263EA4B